MSNDFQSSKLQERPKNGCYTFFLIFFLIFCFLLLVFLGISFGWLISLVLHAI